MYSNAIAITDQHCRQFVDEGYFILERAICDEHLQILRDSCDRLIELMHEEMDALGTDHIHISHRGKRYHIAKKYDQVPRLHFSGRDHAGGEKNRGDGNRIAMFYAWQYGMGCMKKLPKSQELLQMPGRGRLDFKPLLSALAEAKYRGWTEIFMHPVPRGIPILDSTEKVTAEIVRSRAYLEKCLN